MQRDSQYSLVQEMFETVDVIRQFDAEQKEFQKALQRKAKLMLTGEGSSRLFPAKHTIAVNLAQGSQGIAIYTEGGRQAAEYDLSDFAVCGASNSGRTREVVELFQDLNKKGHDALFSLSAHENTTLEQYAHTGYQLKCGNEEAVAATKSVVEQALFYHQLLDKNLNNQLPALADAAEQVLSYQVDADVVKLLAQASTIYYAGRNNGVAEELTLKTNEITRKRSDYLEGTYAVHGIEEVMSATEVVVMVDPFAEEVEKFKQTLTDAIGVQLVAIAAQDVPGVPTLIIPDLGVYNTYLQLMMGWNLMVEVGLACGVNLDKAERARKVGNAVAA